MPALLEAKNLSCGYQDQVIFADLDFTLNQGQFAGLVGPSGSGKTTFLKSLLGLTDLWQGSVHFRGRCVHQSGAIAQRKSKRKFPTKFRTKHQKRGRLDAGTGPLVGSQIGPRIGYVPQVETVDWNFPVTAAEVVMMGRYRRQQLWPWPSKQDRDIAHHLLERVGAAHVAHRAIGELSGGQQQRVFLARALVGNPDLVLLDEPTSSADVQTQHELLHLLWDLNDQGVSILLSTHDLNSVATHLPWVICFNHGIVDQGRPLDVLTSETLSRTFGGDMVVQTQGDRILIANRATAIRHPVQRPRPALLGPDEMGTVAQANLEQTNLEHANFEHANFEHANFEHANLNAEIVQPGNAQSKQSGSKKPSIKASVLNNSGHGEHSLDPIKQTRDKTRK